MKKKSIIFFVLNGLLNISCTSHKNPTPLELKVTCAQDIQGFQEMCKSSGIIAGLSKEQKLVYCELTNNLYDTLYIHLYDVFCQDIYLSKADEIDEFISDSTGMAHRNSILIYTPTPHFFHKLHKGQSFHFLLEADCWRADTIIGRSYNLHFFADSLGQKVEVDVSYKTF